MKKFFSALCAVLLAAALCACAQKAPSAQDTAETVLRELYQCSETGQADFEALLAENGQDRQVLIEAIQGQYAPLAESGAEAVIQNAIPTRIFRDWPDRAVEVTAVTLDEVYTQTDTSAYYAYTVDAAPADAGDGESSEYTGEIHLEKQGDTWYVTSVS